MRTGQPRLGLAAFSHHVGPAQAHRQPCQRPRGVIPSLGQKEHSSFGLLRCPAASSSTTGHLRAQRQRNGEAVPREDFQGHRGRARPQLEPQQRLRRVPLLLSLAARGRDRLSRSWQDCSSTAPRRRGAARAPAHPRARGSKGLRAPPTRARACRATRARPTASGSGCGCG